jgi:polyhydroxyalkanoate synthase
MGLDMVLVDAARGPLRRLVPPRARRFRFGSALARQPGTGAPAGRRAGRELGKVAVGSSELAPGKKDKRFADPAWTGNRVLRRAMQAHLATARTAWELIDDADLDWQDDERIRFTATNVVDALAPSNVPVAQPAVAEGGDRHRRAQRRPGVRRMLRDLHAPPRVPSMVEPTPSPSARILAATPGAVVFRTDVFELIRTGRRRRPSARSRC